MRLAPWSERSVESARLLNPAFLGVLLWHVAGAYASASGKPQPYPLSFLAAPIILHAGTRESLPATTRTSLVSWLGENPKAIAGFAERAVALAPLVKEAILFSSSSGLLAVQESRILAEARPRSMAAFERGSSSEVTVCVKKSAFVGRWFALAGDYTTVMALWGVAP